MIKIWFLYDPTRDWQFGLSLFPILLLSRRDSRLGFWFLVKLELELEQVMVSSWSRIKEKGDLKLE
jgi:hypothetical protein